jgi:hypothetical protein
MPTKRKQKAPPKVTPSNPSADAEGAIFDSLCTTSNITAATNKTPIALDHHLYNHLNDCWVRQASKPQPFVSHTAAALHAPNITKPSDLHSNHPL